MARFGHLPTIILIAIAIASQAQAGDRFKKLRDRTKEKVHAAESKVEKILESAPEKIEKLDEHAQEFIEHAEEKSQELLEDGTHKALDLVDKFQEKVPELIEQGEAFLDSSAEKADRLADSAEQRIDQLPQQVKDFPKSEFAKEKGAEAKQAFLDFIHPDRKQTQENVAPIALAPVAAPVQRALTNVERIVGYWQGKSSTGKRIYLSIEGIYDSRKAEAVYSAYGLDLEPVLGQPATADFGVTITNTQAGAEAVWEEPMVNASRGAKLRANFSLSDSGTLLVSIRNMAQGAVESVSFERLEKNSLSQEKITDYLARSSRKYQRFIGDEKDVSKCKIYYERNNKKIFDEWSLGDYVRLWNLSCVKQFLSKGYKVKSRELIETAFKAGDYGIFTTLVDAADFASNKVNASYLLESLILDANGFSANAVSNSRPINASREQRPMIEYLLGKGVQFEAKQTRDARLVSRIMWLGSPAVLDLLLRQNPDVVRLRDDWGSPVAIGYFFAYTLWGSQALRYATAILNAGFDPNVRFSDGSGSAIDGAIGFGTLELVQLLHQYGGKLKNYRYRAEAALAKEREKLANPIFSGAINDREDLEASIREKEAIVQFIDKL